MQHLQNQITPTKFFAEKRFIFMAEGLGIHEGLDNTDWDREGNKEAAKQRLTNELDELKGTTSESLKVLKEKFADSKLTSDEATEVLESIKDLRWNKDHIGENGYLSDHTPLYSFALQRVLFDKGFYKGNIDGIYGGNTKNAVKQFQEEWNKENKDKNNFVPLGVDGAMGPFTTKALLNGTITTVAEAEATTTVAAETTTATTATVATETTTVATETTTAVAPATAETETAAAPETTAETETQLTEKEKNSQEGITKILKDDWNTEIKFEDGKATFKFNQYDELTITVDKQSGSIKLSQDSTVLIPANTANTASGINTYLKDNIIYRLDSSDPMLSQVRSGQSLKVPYIKANGENAKFTVKNSTGHKIDSIKINDKGELEFDVDDDTFLPFDTTVRLYNIKNRGGGNLKAESASSNDKYIITHINGGFEIKSK